MNVGTHLKKIRETKNISRELLEKLSGLKKSYILKIENNKIGPQKEELKSLTRALNISYIDFLIQAGILTAENFDAHNQLRPGTIKGNLTAEDMDEYNQFQAGTIELVTRKIFEIGYSDKLTAEEYYDEKIFESCQSAQYYLRKKGFELRKNKFSGDSYYVKIGDILNNSEDYVIAHIFEEIKTV